MSYLEGGRGSAYNAEKIVQIVPILNGKVGRVIAEWPLNKMSCCITQRSGARMTLQIFLEEQGEHPQEIYAGPSRNNKGGGVEGGLRAVKLDTTHYQLQIEMNGTAVIRGPRPLKRPLL